MTVFPQGSREGQELRALKHRLDESGAYYRRAVVIEGDTGLGTKAFLSLGSDI